MLSWVMLQQVLKRVYWDVPQVFAAASIAKLKTLRLERMPKEEFCFAPMPAAKLYLMMQVCGIMQQSSI
jgi:hypothetical protein